jgi:hypothetical protein
MQYTFEKSGKLKTLTGEELAVLDKDSAIIVCNRGKLTDGTPYWVYLAVKPSRYEELLRMTAEGRYIVFEEYGRILNYGTGSEIPEDIKEEMRWEYGWDDHYMVHLMMDMEKARSTFLKEQKVQKNKKISDIIAGLVKKKT